MALNATASIHVRYCQQMYKSIENPTGLYRSMENTVGLSQAVPYVCVPQLQDTLGLSQAIHTCPVLPINRCLLVRVLRIPLGCTVLWKTLWDYPRLSCTTCTGLQDTLRLSQAVLQTVYPNPRCPSHPNVLYGTSGLSQAVPQTVYP